MQAYTHGGKSKAEEILAPPTRSGHLSVASKKLTVLAFVALCALVVWGHTSNIAAANRSCSPTCVFQVIFGVLVFAWSCVLLLCNHLASNGTISRTGCFSHGLEVQLVGLSIIFWVPLVATVSAVGQAPALTITFVWLGFFGAMYATFLAYHSFKEQDLPTGLPVGFDEEDYVYG